MAERICGYPIPYEEGVLLYCTKRIGHATAPFKRDADKRHSFTIECDVAVRRLD